MTDPKAAPWGTVETSFAPIHSAARMRDALAVRRELAAGVDMDVVNGRAENGDGGNTALWFAAQGPWPHGMDVARVLIEAGAAWLAERWRQKNREQMTQVLSSCLIFLPASYFCPLLRFSELWQSKIASAIAEGLR